MWALALALGAVLTQGRQVLRGPWPWAGAAVVAGLVAPNIVWQVLHGWPSVTFAHNLSRQTASEWPFPKLVLASLVLLGPLGVPVAGAGAVHLLRRPAVRAVGIATVDALGILLVTGGKPYYPERSGRSCSVLGPLRPRLACAHRRADAWLWGPSPLPPPSCSP